MKKQTGWQKLKTLWKRRGTLKLSMEINPEPKPELMDIIEEKTKRRKKIKVKVFKIFEREETEEEAAKREEDEEL